MFKKKCDEIMQRYETVVTRKNEKTEFYNGIYDRYKYPVLTRDHIPPFWKFDMNPETNPYFMERLGVNAVFNSGAIELNGKFYLVARVEGNDRKSFFAVAESDNGVDGFRFWDYPIYELEYKTLGVIGLGRIGKTVATACMAMGVNVIAYDDYQSEDMLKLGVEYVSLDELLARSDIISMHCPLMESTKNMINKDTIAKMKDGVIILNNSRGGLINEQDLADALHSGKVLGAGLDVMAVEPIEKDNPLLTAPNCFITPHISWAALDTRRRLIRFAIDNVKKYLEGNPINIVN